MRLERAVHWAEILGQVGVIVTLVILILQIRDNTRVLKSQAIMQREAPLTEHFLGESPLPSILAKIKAVDGPEPTVQPFIERYGLSLEESVAWTRHVQSVWNAMAAEYAILGESEMLAQRINGLLGAADHLLWLETGGARRLGDPDFAAYVNEVRQADSVLTR